MFEIKFKKPKDWWGPSPVIAGIVATFIAACFYKPFRMGFFVSIYDKEGAVVAPSALSILITVGTFFGVLAAAYFYRAQAIAQREQASIQNLSLEVKRYDIAVNNMANSEALSVWTYSIHEIFIICKNNPEEFQLVTTNFFSDIISEFSQKLLNPKGNVNMPFRHNALIDALTFILLNYAGVLAKHNKIIGGQKHHYIGRVNGLYLPYKKHSSKENFDFKLGFRACNFERFSFLQCVLSGIYLEECCFIDVRFDSCANFNFRRSLLGNNKLTNCNDMNFDDCFIWERDVEKSPIDSKVIAENFTILDDEHYEAWSKLPKVERLVDWSKYAKNIAPIIK